MRRKMRRFGKRLVDLGLTHSNFGNLSVRADDKIFITRKGSRLDDLCRNDIICVDLARPGRTDEVVSIELVVHRDIYLTTEASAIIHAHSPFAVIQSMLCKDDKVIPSEAEGKYLLAEIPIITGESGSKELAQKAAQAFKEHKGIIIGEHGTMAAGSTIEEAYNIICSIEHVCKVKYFLDTFLTHQG